MKVKIGPFPKKSAARATDVTIDTYDTWSLDHTLALIILPALIQLKLTKHGMPSEFGDVGGEDWSDQGSFDFYKETHDEAWTIGAQRWEDTLDKMIWSFQQLAIEDYDSQYHHGEIDMSWIKSDKTYPNPVTGTVEETYQMVDNNPAEHWYDSVGHQLHEDRIQEGIDLFAKYYRALWD